MATSDLRLALRGYLGIGDDESAREVLDELEQHAFEDQGTLEFLEILRDQDQYGPAWNLEDATFASARCLEARGEYTESLTILGTLFHKYVSTGEYPSALGVLEQIDTYGLDEGEYVDLKQRYDQSKPVHDSERRSRGAAAAVRVLVVGGNETQSKSQGQVKSKLSVRDPQITVEFLRTGWGSNWNQHLDEIEARIANFDAVVVMRFIRTMLGPRSYHMPETKSPLVALRERWSGRADRGGSGRCRRRP